MSRLAIVNPDRCRPKKCQQECKKACPVVKMGKLCVEVSPKVKLASISEELCIGCGICVKKCPFQAIRIINLPKGLEAEIVHKYGQNMFQLHRLPTPRRGQVLGLVGANGTGKSTAVKILTGKLAPNLNHRDISLKTYFRGSELQSYFDALNGGSFTAQIKPQHIDQVGKLFKGCVSDMWKKLPKDLPELRGQLELDELMDKTVSTLSGGEIQRLCIGMVAARPSTVYVFDEASSFLDIKQRLNVSQVIRNLSKSDNYTIVVEHDLSMLDYLSDYICCLYGVPGAYGVVTLPYGLHEGINVFLAGVIPTENLRFRDYELNFRTSETLEEVKRSSLCKYPELKTTVGTFSLTAEAGDFRDSEIIVLLGQNGMGKTTFIKMLAGRAPGVPELNVSYKPQTISGSFDGTVEELLLNRIRVSYTNSQFLTEVIGPLNIKDLATNKVKNLSGGELQRVALALALGKPADVYLLDEPSAYLDSEQRIIAARVIKRFIRHSKKTAFVVEHDFIMATYLADRVVVFEGEPAKSAIARHPTALITGMNSFLRQLEVTFRRDPSNYRPRINKMNSVKDMEQKRAGTYFTLED